MRVRTTLSARSSASRLFGDGALGLVDLEREVHAALQVESALQRHAAHGVGRRTRRSRLTRSTTVRGNSAQTDATSSAAISRQAVLQVGHATAEWRRERWAELETR